MSEIRSPTGSASSCQRSGSLTNLSNTKFFLDSDDSTPKVTLRKRKEPDEYSEIKKELSDIHGKMDKIMNFLMESTANTQKISEDVTLIKEQMSEIKISVANVIEEQNSVKCELKEVQNSLQISNTKIETFELELQEVKEKVVGSLNSPADITYHSEAIITELRERNVRENNIIIRGLPESSATEVKERLISEKAEVMKIIRNIYNESPEPVKLFRLGKYDSAKSRPVKVCFASKDVAIQILRNKKNAPTDGINIYSDQTPAQRLLMEKIKEELKLRSQNGEQDLTIKYTKGVPKIITTVQKNSNRSGKQGAMKL
ncbi:uncharacterized protein LOC132904302 [Amyelois transitella]|uniref:uncharacterized protein LOC132904302 n=1 Tax=Amyelois transitella TaxID=680683 RepID=UPI00298F9AB8|nr:uncharacterized protein LOC132904302 [Amyelois transitella]